MSKGVLNENFRDNASLGRRVFHRTCPVLRSSAMTNGSEAPSQLKIN